MNNVQLPAILDGYFSRGGHDMVTTLECEYVTKAETAAARYQRWLRANNPNYYARFFKGDVK